ncbi:MAG: polyamine aminopropyltransferase [Gammaproteobacteria bacterium]|nr:polyamine aminopropyltransferase [Gammaproteobacteria bacterium]
MTLGNDWFTEIHADGGSAFSLKVTKKLHQEQSDFQRIEVYATEQYGNLMTIDGLYMVSGRDNFLYHEMMTHPVLFTHPAPKRVVIIGGGDCGTLNEVLRHPGVEAAWQVEIDERVTRVSEMYFPELCAGNSDPRARLHFEDGIKFMATAAPGSIDVVIVDSTDPIGPAEGLFTEAFFRDCHRALGEQGVIVQQSESPLYHGKILKALHDAMRAAGFDQTQTLFFPQPVYPSGWWSCTLAGKNLELQTFREADARNKPFETVYYNADIHRAAWAMPEFFRRLLEE